MLEHKIIPPQINFNALNDEINMDEECFKIVTDKQPWTQKNHPRRAAISSFGIGGTNAHVILQEYSESL
ncbi:TPA: ketoacyl-synthetase C-terminal extension domain-containing protein [Legionella anisa]